MERIVKVLGTNGQDDRQLADEPWAPVAQGHPGAANRFDQRAAVPQFKQPSSTSTVSLSTASLSTSTTKIRCEAIAIV